MDDEIEIVEYYENGRTVKVEAFSKGVMINLPVNYRETMKELYPSAIVSRKTMTLSEARATYGDFKIYRY